jgi:hypothetical protein
MGFMMASWAPTDTPDNLNHILSGIDLFSKALEK